MVDEPDELTIDLHVEGDAAIIAIAGEIDIATRDAITDAARAALDGGAGRLVLDMSEVTFMDSPGIAALIETCASGAVTLRSPSQVVVRLIATIGMTDSFVLEPPPTEPPSTEPPSTEPPSTEPPSTERAARP